MKNVNYWLFITLFLVFAGCAGNPEPAGSASVAPAAVDSLSAEDMTLLMAAEAPEAPASSVTPANYKAALDSLEAVLASEQE